MLNEFMDNGEQLPDGVPEKVILVDMSQVSIGTIMAVFKPNELKTLEESLPLIRHTLFSVLLEKVDLFRKDKNKHKVVLCFDNNNEGKGYWRRDYYPPYKDNRSRERAESKYDFEIIYRAADIVRSEMKDVLPFTALDVARMEADDCIAALTKRYAALGSEVIILSSDGDFVQLHDLGNVKQWSATQKKWVQPKHGSATNDLMVKAVKGDRKDNVAPMKCDADHYTNGEEVRRAPPISQAEMDTYFESVDNIPEEFLERFQQNMTVLDLKNMPSDIESTILSAYNDYIVPDGRQLYSFMVKNGLSKLFGKIQRF